MNELVLAVALICSAGPTAPNGVAGQDTQQARVKCSQTLVKCLASKRVNGQDTLVNFQSCLESFTESR